MHRHRIWEKIMIDSERTGQDWKDEAIALRTVLKPLADQRDELEVELRMTESDNYKRLLGNLVRAVRAYGSSGDEYNTALRDAIKALAETGDNQ